MVLKRRARFQIGSAMASGVGARALTTSARLTMPTSWPARGRQGAWPDVLPEPDSPTRPSVSPSPTSRSTPSKGAARRGADEDGFAGCGRAGPSELPQMRVEQVAQPVSTMLADRQVSMIARPGMVIVHQAFVMSRRASDSISPQETSGCCTPNPRNDSDASNRITCPICRVGEDEQRVQDVGQEVAALRHARRVDGSKAPNASASNAPGVKTPHFQTSLWLARRRGYRPPTSSGPDRAVAGLLPPEGPMSEASLFR